MPRGVGARAGSVRGAALAPGDASHVEAPAGLLRGDRRITRYNWPLSALPPGALAGFDLPDCYRALKAKDLRLLEPLGATGRP